MRNLSLSMDSTDASFVAIAATKHRGEYCLVQGWWTDPSRNIGCVTWV